MELLELPNDVPVPTFAPVKELPAECLTAPLTDVGNAQAMAALIGDYVRFDHERQEWLAFIGHIWAPVPESRMMQLAVHTIRFRAIAARNTDDAKRADAAFKWVTRSQSAARLDALIKIARALDQLNAANLLQPGDVRIWDNDPYLLGVANGVIDLRTGELRDGRPEDRLTRKAAVAYDASAQAPRWQRFVEEVLPDPLTREWRRRFIGYSITGLVREEKLVFDMGAGRNGKSTFYGAMREIMGEYYWPLQASVLLDARRGAHTTELTDLEGRRIVNVVEMTENAIINEERVKSIVSVDPITARRMRKDSRTFMPTHKLWLGTNNLPRVKDVTEGIWRRVKVVPWVSEFAVDDTVKDELRAEYPGILRWLVEAATDYLADGLAEESEEMTRAAGDYRLGEDELADWIAARVVKDDGAFLRNTDALKDYTQWSKETGIAVMHQLSPVVFGRTMSKHFGSTVNTKVEGKQVRGWRGIKIVLAPVTMEADDPRVTWGKPASSGF